MSGSGQISPSSADLVGGIAPFVELLIDVRSRLRAANEWALADELRSRLAVLGITLDDGPAGTTWKSSNSQ
jgi:cysteinyl-tRNA synthetase